MKMKLNIQRFAVTKTTSFEESNVSIENNTKQGSKHITAPLNTRKSGHNWKHKGACLVTVTEFPQCFSQVSGSPGVFLDCRCKNHEASSKEEKKHCLEFEAQGGKQDRNSSLKWTEPLPCFFRGCLWPC